MTPRTEFNSRILIIYWKHSVIGIFNKYTEEYNVKTSENDVKHSNSNMERWINPESCTPKREITRARFEGKTLTVPWEHTIDIHVKGYYRK